MLRVGRRALRHDVGAVKEEGDAAEALRLALRTKVAARLIQTLQARVLLRAHTARIAFHCFSWANSLMGQTASKASMLQKSGQN